MLFRFNSRLTTSSRVERPLTLLDCYAPVAAGTPRTSEIWARPFLCPLPSIYYACGRYHERALGVLQALVELNIRSSSTALSMDTFVSYWDSEAPRIGDAHPSQAGLSRWMEAASTTSAMRSGSVVHPGEESVRLVWVFANLMLGTRLRVSEVAICVA